MKKSLSLIISLLVVITAVCAVAFTANAQDTITATFDKNGGIPGVEWEDSLTVETGEVINTTLPKKIVTSYLKPPKGMAFDGVEITDVDGVKTYKVGDTINYPVNSDVHIRFLWKQVKLTIHWSSIDGLDLKGPIVINAFDCEKTIKENIKNAGLTKPYFEKDGYTALSGFMLLKPFTDYNIHNNYNDINQIVIDSPDAENTEFGEENRDVYFVMFKYIQSASAEISVPLCGIKTVTEKDESGNWLTMNQTNKPNVTIPDGVHYHITTPAEDPYLFSTYWAEKADAAGSPFIGTFEGGNQYYADVLFNPDFGYIFLNDAKCTINGMPASDIYIKNALIGTVSLTAQHTPVTVTKPATYTATGTKTVKCSACGKIIDTEVIPKLNKLKNPVIIKTKTVKLKADKLLKKSLTVKRKTAITVKKPKGKVNYKKVKGNKKITVNKKGNIKVKKGLKKGTYKVKIKVTAAGGERYLSTSKTVTVKILLK